MKARSVIHSLAVLGFLFAFGSSTYAAPTTAQHATEAVRGWLRTEAAPLRAKLGNQIEKVQTFVDAQGNPVYHVVYLQPTGFVIVPADDLVEPIIAFSPSKTYDLSAKNALHTLVSRDLPGRVRAVQKAGGAGKDARLLAAQHKWLALRTAGGNAGGTAGSLSSISNVWVAPLVQTTWDQSYAGTENPGPPDCYNYYTPGPKWPTATPGSVDNYVCGCVATAMAQFLYYWQYPTTGVGTASYTIQVTDVNYTATTRGGDGNGGPYNWGSMVLSPNASTPTADCQAIWDLCYDAGVSVGMDYNEADSGESGAYGSAVPGALTGTFLYSNAILGGNDYGTEITLSVLLNMVNTNLDAGKPVMFGIVSPYGAHFIVGDGYGYNNGTLYHHLNLGWSGYDNAWYNLPDIGTDYGFTTVYQCVYNVYITGSGEIVSGRVTDASGNPLAGVTVTATSTGGTLTATTNSNGIYALAEIPSNTTYTLTPSVTGYVFSPSTLTATTGTSASLAFSTGDVWGENLTGTNAYSLTVQSTPPTGVVISSTTGQGGTTNYTTAAVPYGADVNLIAPAIDPMGYVFVQWTVNGTAQQAGQKSVDFTMPASVTTAIATYQLGTYTLSVQSTPPTGVAVTSATSDGGTTPYTVPAVVFGTSVTLTAPATDPTGYMFTQWVTFNGEVQQPGQKTVTFTLTGTMSAVAVYTPITVTVQSTPPTGVTISSTNAGQGGTTNYSVSGLNSGANVILTAPTTDPAGYAFSQWWINGMAQTAGKKTVNFPVTGPTTVIAEYTCIVLTVQSAPPTGLAITSTTRHGGTTNYSLSAVPGGTNVNLMAPATDPAGYAFTQWCINGQPQQTGLKMVTFSVSACATPIAMYTPITLTVQSTTTQSTALPGVVIASSTGSGGTADYTLSPVIAGTRVSLIAPASLTLRGAGYTFQNWTLGGQNQTKGQATLTFTIQGPTTAVAVYAPTQWTLTVQSTPITKVSVAGTPAGASGTTNYTAKVNDDSSVTLSAPSVATSGGTAYIFQNWLLNGQAQPAGRTGAITFVIHANTTAVAVYAVTQWAVTVQSTPIIGVKISASPASAAGVTSYFAVVNDNTTVKLTAPSSVNSAGATYSFQTWTLNGVPQVSGRTSVAFAVHEDMSAVAVYGMSSASPGGQR